MAGPGRGRLNLSPRWPFWVKPTYVVPPVVPVVGYRANVLADNPVAYWRLGASPLVDETANANTLTASASAPTSSASLIASDTGDTSRDFSGSSQFYTAADSSSLSLTGPLTIEAWLYADTVAGIGTIVRKDSIQFALRNNGGTLEYYYDDGAAQGVGATSALASGTLYHVAVTDDLATVRFYINGTLFFSAGRSTGTPATDTAGAVGIGATYSGGSPSEFWDGRIDEVALYGTALSAARIAAHYAAAQVAGTDWAQPVADSVTMSDAAPVFNRAITVADSVTPSDQLAFDRAITVADTVTMSDSAAAGLAYAVNLNDTVTPADSATTATGKGVAVNDSVTMSDAAVFDRGLAVADSVTPTDALVFQRELGLVDTVSLTDVVAFAEEIHIGDTLSLTDLCDPVKTTGGSGLNQSVNDTVTMSDAQTFQRDVVWPIADSVTLADLASTQRGIFQTVADTVSPGDSLALTLNWQLAVNDTVTMADQLAFLAVLQRVLADTVTLADNVVTLLEGMPSEGFAGPFDTDLEHGRSNAQERSDDFDLVPAGASRSRVLSGAYTSSQSGKIGAR